MTPPDDFDPIIGVAEVMEQGLRRIVAPNPSPMTYRGTNTYLVGETALAVVDPGPDNADHLHAILQAVEPHQHVSHIVVTHSHLDHSPLARALSDTTGAPILAFGDATAGRSDIMRQLAKAGLSGGGEGIDKEFAPDQCLADGDVISGADWQLEVLHTPGHLGNHISLGFGDACLTADHVMGWASSLVSPPDGDLTDFMSSCHKLMRRDWRVFYPGHGAPITEPKARLLWLIEHRHTRERAILDALNDGPATAADIADAVYIDTPRALLPAATRNVLAHLVDLMGKSRVHPLDPLSANARFVRK
ncbi:MBL fold metallo-hydrolase [Tateyamaria sp. ANG-S1]|uniref:MBL fold metallo-hydrolase n=1 Tax=Tateyamaria sp. ANG-S1 TaxID=1577905 RepID=UPI00057D6083|nr:MBL fold metallo-hydrolase [Tateyamaria sp. ANG-S1]KIC48911.1 metallo-beta-lactamase [Tateyamaria sp. ANG-S1]